MNLPTAWSILGKNWESIVQTISSVSSLKDKVELAERMLVEARKTAKKLMAANHPDVNPEDPNAECRFRKVVDALSVIESSTVSMRKRFEDLTQREGRRRQADGFVCISQESTDADHSSDPV